MSRTTVLILAVLTSVVVFGGVQDRVTAAGARRYVELQRQSSAAGQASSITVDAVMRPAIRDSVRTGALWGGAVLLLGACAAALFGRK